MKAYKSESKADHRLDEQLNQEKRIDPELLKNWENEIKINVFYDLANKDFEKDFTLNDEEYVILQKVISDAYTGTETSSDQETSSPSGQNNGINKALKKYEDDIVELKKAIKALEDQLKGLIDMAGRPTLFDQGRNRKTPPPPPPSSAESKSDPKDLYGDNQKLGIMDNSVEKQANQDGDDKAPGYEGVFSSDPKASGQDGREHDQHGGKISTGQDQESRNPGGEQGDNGIHSKDQPAPSTGSTTRGNQRDGHDGNRPNGKTVPEQKRLPAYRTDGAKVPEKDVRLGE